MKRRRYYLTWNGFGLNFDVHTSHREIGTSKSWLLWGSSAQYMNVTLKDSILSLVATGNAINILEIRLKGLLTQHLQQISYRNTEHTRWDILWFTQNQYIARFVTWKVTKIISSQFFFFSWQYVRNVWLEWNQHSVASKTEDSSSSDSELEIQVHVQWVSGNSEDRWWSTLTLIPCGEAPPPRCCWCEEG